ncbi:alkaline phosphatase family protein [Phreatobacter stygius]|uniref:Nucleotide pyrophosphatase n=1 Tax=Phreatobacter stygius TaxID=1940610 RepID=A0A4D7B4F7_9HYPH|nr:alkaline phosphatase family protein [Phreatobacter stygius]QCI68334.1 nucleotide pyrophosphatase [Phreatobacter stygius]
MSPQDKAPATAPRRVIAVMLDGLRRDFITPDATPALAALRARATWFDAHRTVFPSVTRVVSSSFATGCRPAHHGLAGNTVALVEDGRLGLHDVGRPEFVETKRRLTGTVLARPTLAERLADHGGAVIFNNVSPGAAYMHDPDGHGHVYHRAGSFGPGRRPIQGDRALEVTPDAAGDRAAAERFIAEVVHGGRPAFGLIWLCEPDTTQHAAPLGSATHRAILATADSHAAMIIAAVARARAEGEDILLLVGSDHGHQTVRAVIDIDAELIEAGLKAGPGSTDVVVAPNGTAALVYVDGSAEDRIAAIEGFLAERPWVGRLFTRDSLAEAGLPAGGGLAFAIALAASDEPNAEGVPGLSYAAKPADGKADRLGCGQHGGLGTFEQLPTLMLDGGGFTAGRTVTADTSVIDIAPTILRFLGRPIGGVDGRPLQEL